MRFADKPLGRFLPTGAVLAIGLLLSVTIFIAARTLEDQNARAAFQGAAQQRLDALETGITQSINGLASLGAFYDASQEVDREEFARFTAAILGQNRALQALEWIPRVSRAVRGSYELSVRRAGTPPFQISEAAQGQMVRAGERDEYYPVFYVEPLKGNERALGFDLASDAIRREALQRASSTGRMTATSRVSLVQERADGYGFLVFRPVYSEGPPVSRSRVLTGFVLGVFRVQGIVEETGGAHASGIAVALFDRDAESREQLLYPRHARFDSSSGFPMGLQKSRFIPVAGRKWEIVCYPLPNAFRSTHWSIWSILAAELLVTFLLASYLHLTLNQKLAIERTVAGRTSELNTALQQLADVNRALAKSERTYETLCELSTDAILIEHDRVISFANGAAVRLLKLAGPEDLIGRRVSDFASPPFRAIARETESAVYSTGMQLPPVEGQIVCADDTLVDIEVSICSFSDSDGTTVQTVFRNITERKRAHAELMSAKELAETATRAKTMFLATMSHELRTPLNAILGFSELLEAEMADQGFREWERYLVSIRRSGTHLLERISEILDLSKIDAGKMELKLEDFDVSEIVRDIAATAEPLAADNGNEIRIVCEPAILHGDRVRIQQCLLNLVGNACKFTHEGEVQVAGCPEGPWYVVRIVDSGIGIAEEDIGRLFGDFTQVDASRTRKYGGTGLGLAISRRLCRLMGGDITVESKLGQGSTFTMRIPLRTVPSDAAHGRAAERSVAS